MSMPFIREPSLVNRWLHSDRKRARCISCNGCFKPGLEEGGIYCVVEKKSRKKRLKNNHSLSSNIFLNEDVPKITPDRQKKKSRHQR